MKNLIFGFSVIALIFLTGCDNNNNNDTELPNLPYTYTNWMSKIDDGSSIADITIPGTHDSGAFDCDTGATELKWVLAQSLTIRQQLDLGVRWLDIRVRAQETDNGYYLGVYHDKYYLNLSFYSVLKTAKEFLEDHPSEAVMITIKQEHSSLSDGDFSKEIYKKLEAIGLSKFYLEQDSLPAMGEVRGKIVVFRRFALGDLGHKMGYNVYWNDQTTGEGHHHNNYSFYVQDYYHVDPGTYFSKTQYVWATMLHALGGGHDGTLYLNYASAYATWHPNKTVASSISPLVDAYVKALYHVGKAGVIFVNFAGTPDTSVDDNLVPHLVKHIIEINEGL